MLAITLLVGCQTATMGPPQAAEAQGVAVEKAGLPFTILDTKTGRSIPPEQFYDQLATNDAICIGETHTNPHHHWAQLHLLDRLSERASAAGVTLALGLEMFQRPFQQVLNDYGTGRIDEMTMLARTDWEARWGYDYALYRPIIRLAVERNLPLLALNLSNELRQQVSQNGLQDLSPGDRNQLPDIELQDTEHRAWWNRVMGAIGHHGHGGGDRDDDGVGAAWAERGYTIQVLWDETMADTAAGWLAGGNHRQIVILAGSGHCHSSAILRRLQRRGVASVVAVRPLLSTNNTKEDGVADVINPIVDYLVVMSEES